MDDLLGTSEVAVELGITRQGVDYLIRQGLMKADRIGRFVVVTREEVERVKALDRKPGRPKAVAPGQ